MNVRDGGIDATVDETQIESETGIIKSGKTSYQIKSGITKPNLEDELFGREDLKEGIFHARYLETQHAIIRIDRGFDLFKQNDGFRRNFFTLNMAESSHLRECRDLPDATI